MNWLKKIILPVILVIEILIFTVVASFFVVTKEAQPYLYYFGANGGTDGIPSAQTALVPGAGVLADGTLSPVLQDRVDAAIKIYKAGLVQKILVTGDNSTLAHNEVNPMSNYLMGKGIPPKDIFLDHAGFDTYSSMYRARTVFGVSSTIVVTESFHLPRSVYIARSLGMEAYGVSADNGHYLWTNYTHEWFADVKAIGDLLLRREPKYLGPLIPIAGDGTQTQ